MGKRLLLADDSVTIQKVVEITFADKDYELDLTGNGNEALQAAQKQRPDLILADVFMPGMDGYKLCEQIKSTPDLAGVPVLLLAGTFEPFDEERAAQVGAAGWITKPFTSQALVDKVEETLAQIPQEDEQWHSAPSKSPAESMLGAFEQAAATDFGSGRRDEFAPETDAGAGAGIEPPVPPQEPSPAASLQQPSERPSIEDIHPQESTSTDFGSGGREDFSFEDLAAPEEAASLRQEESSEAEKSGTTEPVGRKMDYTPEAPDADFSFTPVEPVEKKSSFSAEEPATDPFTASSEQSADFSFSVPEDKTETEPDLPSLDEFAPPKTGATATTTEEKPDIAQGVIELQEEDIVAEGKYAATKSRVEARAAYLSDAELERIVERVAVSVIERLATPVMEKVVWEVVPDLAESMIREEMEKIKRHADTGS
jgi:CheY-like chemotaxis protein